MCGYRIEVLNSDYDASSNPELQKRIGCVCLYSIPVFVSPHIIGFVRGLRS
jgi:hypothetical protein